jgi:cardiolipin synthase
MSIEFQLPTLLTLGLFALQVAVAIRAILRPNREPSARTAWVLVILAVPTIGLIAYMLFGETNIGQRRLERYRRAVRIVASRAAEGLRTGDYGQVAPQHRHLFRLCETINGLGPLPGSRGRLLADASATFDALEADIDAARDSVHLVFYIWLDDSAGLRIAGALKRAAARGVTVRAIADDIGSRAFIRSRHWSELRAAGVHVAAALPVQNILLHPFRGRIDLRNHRKMVVIDNAIAWCGSFNCADPEFRPKAKYGPWVDEVVRFEGPVAVQMQCLFIQDWMAHSADDLAPLIAAVPAPVEMPGIVTQVIGTGPTMRASAMPEVVVELIHAARRELLVTTPYYVPTDGMHEALCTAARRGVRTVLMVPERNDSWVVSAASRSYYPDLIAAGVMVFEYPSGLLHAKILTLDGEVALIGSANLDRRSFELNFENNLLLQDRDLTASLAGRQESYIAASRHIGAAEIAAWSRRRRIWNNAVAMMGPIL